MSVESIRRGAGRQTLVSARVCVRSLPPDPQGNRTRISWDPWTVRSGARSIKPGFDGSRPAGLFPPSRTYAVGDCASGVLPFPSTTELDEVDYANGVGDRAVWDAERLSQPPTTSRLSANTSGSNGSPAERTQFGSGTFIVNDDIRPGRYKSHALSGGVCTWTRLKNDSGDADAVIAGDVTDGAASVTIESSDGAFESEGCAVWVRH